MKPPFRFFAFALTFVFAGAIAQADEFVFKNGDRLVGKLLSAADGKAAVESVSAGKVTIAFADLKTFSTDEPLALHLKDGTVLNRKIVAAAEEGKFAIDSAGAVQAQSFSLADIDKINPPPVAWTGSISAGVTAVRGNTYSNSASVDLAAQRRSDMDRLSFNAGYFASRQEDNTTGATSTTKRYTYGSMQYDYFFSKALYGYANAKVEKDAIALLDLRLTSGVGAGYQISEEPSFNLSVEGGVSFLSENFTGPTPTNDTLTGRAAYHISSQLNPSVKAFHNAEWYESFEDFEDQVAKADAGIRASLTKSMFAEAKAVWQWDSTPAIGKERTDVTYIFSLGWTF